MTKIDDIASEVIVAKEQLKQINATINNDREIVKKLDNEILEKKEKIKELKRLYDINPKGCEHCMHGYKGRICVAEVLFITSSNVTSVFNSISP